jgi:hypothetical protein
MPIIRLVWIELDDRCERSRTFDAAGVPAAFKAAAALPADLPMDLWVDGEFRARLARVLHEGGWYWRIG